jgi:hypothetical protein
VLQGSVPSSLFFLCLSIACPNVFVIRNLIFMLMSDDPQIYLSGIWSDLDGLIARLNEDLETIHRWSIENGLLLNPAKSQAILVLNSPPELPLPLLFLTVFN